jgi:oxygen-dependent protoporphyrinogen oxidase
MKATFPRLTDLEARYGSVLKGFMIRKREERREKRIDLFSFKNGMGTLPDTLSRELEKNLVRDIRIDSIGPVSSGRSGFRLQGYRNGVQQTFDAEEVVLAVPAYEAARLIAPFSERIAQELRLIEYAPVAIVNFGFSAAALKRTFTGSGCLIPKNENRLLLGFRINSNLYRGRAPSGKMIVTCFMGGMRNPGIVRESDEAITGKARLELQTLLGIEEKPEFVHLVRHLQAIPQYDMKHLQRLEVIAGELERVEGLHITGNYLKGVSIWDCISQGLDLGRRISEEQKRRAGVSN